MKNLRIAVAILAAIAADCPHLAQAQGVLLFYDRPVSFGTRGMGTGNASVADANDVTSMYWNPATVAFLRNTFTTVSSLSDASPNSAQSLRNNIAFPVQLGTDQAIGLGVVVGYFGQVWSDHALATYGIDIAYARKFSRTWSVGALLSLRYAQSKNSSLYTEAGSLGIYYSPAPGLSYGLAYRGIGSGAIFSQQSTGDQSLGYEKQLPQDIEFGATFRFPTTRREIVVLSMTEILRTKDWVRGNKAGLEITPFDFLSLRIGITRIDFVVSGTAGVGLNFHGFRLDYATTPNASSVRLHQLSFSIPLGG